jgi:OOP family OmpA-OmpF porin
MRPLLFAALSALSLSLCSTAVFAKASGQDAAYDEHSQPVYNSHGDCVRTKWLDANDPCMPKTAEVKKVEVVAAPALPEVSLEQRTIYFDFDKATLTDEAKAKLDNLATIINDSQSIADVRIHGFTDQFGTKGYNDVLANKRAAAVKAYLDSKSRLSATVAEVLGLGKSSPTEGCGAIKKREEKISCMAKERRVEIEFKATK